MGKENQRRKLSRCARSGGNDSRKAPATMPKGEKPKLESD